MRLIRWLRGFVSQQHRVIGGKPNDIAKLLDNGWQVRLWRNALGSYTANATCRRAVFGHANVEADDFTPARALYRLVEKVTTDRIVPSEKVKSCD